MQFRIGTYAISGIKVNRLDIYGEVCHAPLFNVMSLKLKLILKLQFLILGSL